MKARYFLLALLGAARLNAAVVAAEAPSVLVETYNFRMDLAKAVAAREVTPAAALLQLKAAKPGLARQLLGEDADLGQAMLALGHHLLGFNRSDAAEVFFRAADESLGKAILLARDNRLKADCLAKRALIRANYLGQAREAKVDIDEAIRLQPEDTSLQKQRAILARGRAEAFKATAVIKN